MILFKDLTANQLEISKVIIDTDVFGIERSIKVVHKDGEISTYHGSEIKYIDFYIDICDDEDKKVVNKKIYYQTDTIQKIEVYERDKEFYPSLYKVFLEDGRSFVVNNNESNIIDAISDGSTSLSKYLINSLLERYNTDVSNIGKCYKDNPIKKKLNDSNNPINSFLKKHITVKNKTIKEDSKIVSSERYNKIDIVSFNDLEFPSSIVVYYSSGKSIMVHDEYICNKYLKSALLRGINTCSYYPEFNVSRVANITTFTDKFDDKMSLKKHYLNKLFAIFSKEKKLKK